MYSDLTLEEKKMEVGSCFTCGRDLLDPACDECTCPDGRELWKPPAYWHLDLFSTFLSRKHSLHKRCGKKMYVKTHYKHEGVH